MDARRRSRRLVGDVVLDCIEAGPRDGPCVILLHGFPEDAESWAGRIDALAAAGFRVLAPDQRGYGGSDKPKARAAYAIERLAEDVAALADGVGCGQFDLIGHDWGGAVAFWVAARHPGKVRRLAVINAPHPGAMRRYALRHPLQLLRSSYMAAFQIPRLPERLLSLGRAWWLAKVVSGSARPGAFPKAEMARLRGIWSDPAALTPMLAWYRALSLLPKDAGTARVTCPTLILWGEHDAFLRRGLARASARLCDHARVSWMAELGHWPHREAPRAVDARLVNFLSKPD